MLRRRRGGAVLKLVVLLRFLGAEQADLDQVEGADEAVAEAESACADHGVA
jgi:hypothetical protein